KSRYNAVSSGRTGRISTRSPSRVVSCPSFKPKSFLSGIGATGAVRTAEWLITKLQRALPFGAPHTGLAPMRLLCSHLRPLPAADVPRFRHQREAKNEAHQRYEDRREQRVKEAAGRCECRRGDERH